MKLLITGASGFLGGRAARYFAKNYEVVAPTHADMDITDGAAVQAYFRAERPDFVFHCGAISDVGTCEKEPERSFAINVEGAVNVAGAAAAVGAKCVLCSSDQVYFGGSEQKPHRENEKLAPKNRYGREKLEMEQRCLDEVPDCVLLRLSWMYDGKPLREGEHGDFLRTLLPKLRAGERGSYPVYDRRGITDVGEVLANAEKCFHLPGGVYNFGAPNDCATYELMERVFTRLGLDRSLLEPNETAFADHPRNLCMDQEKAERAGLIFSSTEAGLIRAIRNEL